MKPWRRTLPMCRSWIRDSGRDIHAAVRVTALIFVRHNFASPKSEIFVVFSSRSMMWGLISKCRICTSQLRRGYSIPQAAPREISYISSQLKEVFPSPGKTHLSSDPFGINSYKRARFDPLVEKNSYYYCVNVVNPSDCCCFIYQLLAICTWLVQHLPQEIRYKASLYRQSHSLLNPTCP